MRNAIVVVVVALIAVAGTSLAYAQPPVDGTWKSTLGEMDEGRQSTSWSAASGRLQVNNTLHAESWDGATLGAEWKVLCPFIVNVIPPLAPPAGGTGNTSHLIIYAGGTIWLDGAGPWGGGDPSYTGNITTYIENRAIQWVGGAVVGTAEDHSVSADIVGYSESCIAFGVGNGAWEGDTDNGALPANYPGFLNSLCAGGPTLGRWGQYENITLTVKGCVVPNEEQTWGAVKSRYTD